MSNRYKAAVLTLILATMIISGCSDGNAPAVTTAAETESTSAQTTTSAPEEAEPEDDISDDLQPEESEPDEPAPKQAEKEPAPEADGQTYITSLRDAFHSYADASGEFEEALQSDDFDTVDTALDNMENALHEIENAPHPAKYSELHEKLSAATEDEMHYVGLCRKFAGYVEKRDELTESDNEELQKLTNEMGEFNSDFLQVFSEIVKTVAADLG